MAEGSKSEIFRRCDIGASNENQVPVAVQSDAVDPVENIVQPVEVDPAENTDAVQPIVVENIEPVAVLPVENTDAVQPIVVDKVVKKRAPKVKNELPVDKKEPKKRGPKAKISIPVTEPLSIGFTDFAYEVAEGSKSEIFRRCDIGASNENENTPGTVDVIIPNEEHAKLTLIMPEEQELQEDLVLTEVFINDVLFYTDVEGNFYNNEIEKIQNPY